MTRWRLYRRCKGVVNHHLITIVFITIMMFFFIYTMPKDKQYINDSLGKILWLLILSTIMTMWECVTIYNKYLYDIFFRKVSKKNLYVVSIYKSRRISDIFHSAAEDMRFNRIKRVIIRGYNEEQQRIIEHNDYMREIKAPKRQRKHLQDVSLKEFTCYDMPMCNELKKGDKIEIIYLKGTKTIVDIKRLTDGENLSDGLYLEKRDERINEVEKYYKVKKIIGTIIFTVFYIVIYLLICFIAACMWV